MLKGCLVAVGLLLAAAQCQAQTEESGVFPTTHLTDDDPLNLEGYRIWLRFEYLFWKLQTAPLPTQLVTTGGQVNQGAIGSSDTVVLFGGQQDYGWQSGGRVAAGLWFDAGNRLGVETSFFVLSAESGYYSNSAPGGGVLSFPGYTVINNTTTPTVLNLASSSPASVSVENDIRFLGGNLDLVFVPYRSSVFEINLLAGFASVFLKEDYTQSGFNSSGSSSSVAVGGITTATTTNITTQIQDSFGTQNIFYGGELGARGILRLSPFFLELTGKVAFGDNNQIITVVGQTTNNVASHVVVTNAKGFVLSNSTTTTTTATNAGYLAQPSNSGIYNENAFCLLPWGQIRVGVDLGTNIRLSVGYDVLLLSTVVRPGNQIDQVMGTLNGLTHPVFPLNTSSFLAQGVNLGLEIRF